MWAKHCLSGTKWDSLTMLESGQVLYFNISNSLVFELLLSLVTVFGFQKECKQREKLYISVLFYSLFHHICQHLQNL